MSGASLEEVWETLPFPSLVLSGEDNVTRANSAAENLLGTSERQLKKKVLGQIFSDQSVVLDTIRQVRETSASVSVYGIEIPSANRETWLCNLLVNFLNHDAGELLLCFQSTGVAEKMSQSLTNRTAARSVSAMAAMLAHEVRNPLAGISGAAQLLSMNANDDDQNLADLIGKEARRIGTLVSRFEHFSDSRPVRFQSFNIHDVLDRAIRSAMAGYGSDVSFVKNYDPSLPLASGEEDQILQVFQNLLKNACEATSETQGVIKVSTAYQSGVKFNATGEQTASLPLQIKVSDNGGGIPNHIISEIFEPFVTSKLNGTGLGLPLVSKIVTDHGGLIEVDTTRNGTEFTIRLPIWTGKG